jgi:hypothetical protein
MLLCEHGTALSHASFPQVGEAADDQARGFAARVGVDDLDAFHGLVGWHGVNGLISEI